MPYAAALVGVCSFTAGLLVANGRHVTAGFLVGIAAAAALWMRWRHKHKLDEAFDRGAGYITNTRRQMRSIDEMEVHEVPADSDLNQMVARIRAGLDGEEEETDDT